jgi:hypothetical protein
LHNEGNDSKASRPDVLAGVLFIALAVFFQGRRNATVLRHLPKSLAVIAVA